jgi:hypothetical protein
MAKKLKLVPLPWLAREDTFPIDPEVLYEMIPVEHKMDALPLLKKLQSTIAVNGNNQVKYSDGSVGSHILDLVKHHLKIPGAQKPRDYKMFRALTGEKPVKRPKVKRQKTVVVKKRKGS